MATTNTDHAKHGELFKVKADELHDKAGEILDNANAGIQSAILDHAGNVRAVVGLNGCRYLPSADPDPLEEALLDALAAQDEHPK